MEERLNKIIEIIFELNKLNFLISGIQLFRDDYIQKGQIQGIYFKHKDNPDVQDKTTFNILIKTIWYNINEELPITYRETIDGKCNPLDFNLESFINFYNSND